MVKPHALVDLLRRWRELAPRHVVGLLAELPQQLDAEPCWSRDPSPLLMRIYLRPRETGIGIQEWLSSPLDSWGPVEVIHVNPAIEIPAMTLQPVASEITRVPKESAAISAPGRLAALLYELLGGRSQRLHSERLSPLPAIGSNANDVLRNAIQEKQIFRSCCEFWDCWVNALEPEDQRVPVGMVHWRSHDGALAEGGGSALELIPDAKDAPTIRVVAGRALTIGRSRSKSDVPLHAWTRGTFSAKKTKLLSRIHVTWQPAEGFLDGYNGEPSVNGSAYAGRRLSANEAVPAVRRGALMLGPELEVLVTALPRPGNWLWIVNGEADDAVTHNVGVLTFEPPEESPKQRETLWIAREVGWMLGADDRPRWGMDPCNSGAWLIHRKGRFLLANHHFTQETLELDGKPLLPRTVTELKTGQLLRTGTKTWRVEVHG